MLCDRIVQVADSPTLDIDDVVDLNWWDLQRRALRITTRAGLSIRVLLPLGVSLFEGAILTNESGTTRINVQLRECEVFTIFPRTQCELANLALELGNLHCPSQFAEGSIRVVIGGPVVALLAEMGIPFERQFVKFNPRRCVGMPEIRVAADLRVTTK